MQISDVRSGREAKRRRTQMFGGMFGNLDADTCPFDTFNERSQELNSVCCLNGDCVGQGLPPTCSFDCAIVYNSIYGKFTSNRPLLVTQFCGSILTGCFWLQTTAIPCSLRWWAQTWFRRKLVFCSFSSLSALFRSSFSLISARFLQIRQLCRPVFLFRCPLDDIRGWIRRLLALWDRNGR